jgi:DNA-binding transcriptional LysR family regulator
MDTPLNTVDWSLVQAFLAVAETGSLSAAARRMGTSQPTLGRQVRALERQLKAELFHRQPRGLSLTPTGAALVGPARSMRDAVHQIALTAAGQQAALEGTVRITASLVVSAFHLPPIIADLRRREPRIAIELVPSDDTRNLLYREADIAVRMYRPDQLDLITRHLGDFALAAFAAKTYAARRGLPGSPAELLDHDVIGFDRDTAIIDGFRAGGLTVDRDWFKTRVDDPVAYWALVRAGAGIGFGQTSIGRGDPLLQEIDLGLPLPRLPVWLTAHEAMRHTPRIRAVWDALAEGLQPLVS